MDFLIVLLNRVLGEGDMMNIDNTVITCAMTVKLDDVLPESYIQKRGA